MSRFTRFAWFVLLFNLADVAWGVFVRAAKFGDGCGSHWPMCDADSHPLMGPGAWVIELSHRVSSGIAGLLVIGMLVWAWREFPKEHPSRRASVAAMGLMLLEGAIGAALVLFRWVTNNDSAARAAGMATHVVNTFLLLGAISVVAIGPILARPVRLRGQGTVTWILGMAAFGLIMLGISGSISALGHQLHETPDVMKAALNPATHWMVRLQPLHPLIAASVGLYLLLAVSLLQHLRPDPLVKRAARWAIGLFAAQALCGAINVWAKAPIGLQMLHLVAADANWISLVVLGAFTLRDGIERVESRPAPEELSEVAAPSGRGLVNAYVALTKPRVISLLLFTAVASSFAANGEFPGWRVFLAVLFGGYAAAGAANAINMVIDRDIDYAMARTRKRPTVTQAIPSRDALLFAFMLAAASFSVLWGFATLLSAVMAFSGLVFYVVVYTLLLKRRTWHNIVIGGAAGAFPPLVGWAAVTNSLPPLALYLFAIVFVWTPVHFWALALLLKDDYAAAGVPMLPVVKGDRFTVIQIGLYAIGTAVVTLVPFIEPHVGWIYAVTAVILNVFLLAQCVQLYRNTQRPQASRLFHYSMVYLAVLFLMLAVDRMVVHA